MLVDLDADLAVAVTYDVVVAFVVVALGADLLRAQTADDTSADGADRPQATSRASVPGTWSASCAGFSEIPALTIGYWSPDVATYRRRGRRDR